MKKVLLLTAVVLNLGFSYSSVVHAGRYDGLVRQLDDFMGGGASIKHSDDTKFVSVGGNGNRFRMDYDGHGDRPHFHLETQRPNGEYGPAPDSSHREYFSE